ncbi:MAG: PhoH family protein, partial [Firmicutes bacterium]|nr:PhoH family protein [Bacillota bacterium]
MAENELIFEISGDCLQAVFGEYDSNILKLEAAFGTSIVNRGDNVKVTGDTDNCKKTEKVIRSLEALAMKNEPITEQTINYLIESVNEDLTAVEKLSDEYICLTQNGRPVKPKTLGQKKYTDLIRKNTIVFGIGPAGTGKTYL